MPQAYPDRDEQRIALAELERDDPTVNEDDVRATQEAYEQCLCGEQQ